MMTQDRAAPAKILLDSGADPNALVSPLMTIEHDNDDYDYGGDDDQQQRPKSSGKSSDQQSA